MLSPQARATRSGWSPAEASSSPGPRRTDGAWVSTALSHSVYSAASLPSGMITWQPWAERNPETWLFACLSIMMRLFKYRNLPATCSLSTIMVLEYRLRRSSSESIRRNAAKTKPQASLGESPRTVKVLGGAARRRINSFSCSPRPAVTSSSDNGGSVR